MSFGLFQQHAALLRASGVSDEVAQARGYVSVDTKATLARYAFTPAQRSVPGLLIPLWTVTGQRGFAQYRPDNPRLNADGKPVKYETPPQARMALDVHPRARLSLADPQQPLFITEGVRKADAAISRGLCCVALIGVWNWRGRNEHGGKTALADWEQIALNGRRVFIVFDSDVITKPQVRAALARFKAFLAMREAQVALISLPTGPNGEKVGLDDYLGAGHTVEELHALATGDLPAAPPAALTDTPFHLTDLGASELFVSRHGAQVRYAHDLRQWFLWTGTHWQPDENGAVLRLAQDLVRALYADAATAPDDRRRLLAEFALKLESEARLTAALELAKAHLTVAVTSKVFDQQVGSLVCLNGTVDLRTGDLGPHRSEDLSTVCVPLAYDPQATSALWQQTLDLALPPDRQAYLQRVIGCAATGQRDEDLLPIISGPGGAAKTTIMQALLGALGPYGATASFETFLLRKHVDGGPREDIAALRGKRLVLAGEVQSGRELDAALLKQLTGGDVIRARALYREGIEFRPRFIVALVCNEAPRANSTDDALFRRVQFLPFDRPIPKAQQLPAVKRLLREVLGTQQAILRWIVDGAREYYRTGLQPPESVLQATQAYHFDQNPVWPFVRECCVLAKGHETLVSDLRTAYEAWCGQEKEKSLGGRAFNKHLEVLGCRRVRTGHERRKAWLGVSLAPAGSPDTDRSDRSEPVLGKLSHEYEGEKLVGGGPRTSRTVRTTLDAEPPAGSEVPVRPPDGVPLSLPIIQRAVELLDATVLDAEEEVKIE